jgi:hypothetical protein
LQVQGDSYRSARPLVFKAQPEATSLPEARLRTVEKAPDLALRLSKAVGRLDTGQSGDVPERQRMSVITRKFPKRFPDATAPLFDFRDCIRRWHLDVTTSSTFLDPTSKLSCHAPDGLRVG